MPSSSIRQAFARDPMARLVPPGPMSETEFPMNRPATAEDAELVEDAEFKVTDVAEAPDSEFTHFLDGAQKVCRVMYYGLSPVVLAHISAAMIERQQREMLHVKPDQMVSSLVAIGPDDAQMKQRFSETECDRYEAVEVDQPWSPIAVGTGIRDRVGTLRKDMEVEAAAKFDDGRLLVDGPIGQIGPRLPGKFVVGIVKSHEKLYVKSPDRQRAVFRLKRGQRTSVFHRNQRYSTYLRIRTEPNREPLFGVVRLEVPATTEFLNQIDTIAGWILAETRPLSLPDPRYHVLPYPIHMLEMHLKARQPSDAKFRGILGI